MTWLEEERARGARLEAAFGEVRTEMRLGFSHVDKRFETVIGEMKEGLEKGLKEQTRFLFLAWAVQLAAIVGLYAR
jgi:hypothetical protein